MNIFLSLESIDKTRYAVGKTRENQNNTQLAFIGTDASSVWPVGNDMQTIDSGDNIFNTNIDDIQGLPNYIYEFITKETLSK